ncbi:MAG: CRTAC1 family protein [Acidobacteria bacterium]|nr:CRTAC1 family protein [Acidobacteriota bacterium]
MVCSTLVFLIALVGDPPFVPVSRGIDFIHKDFRSGKNYYIETTGAGACWFDYDHDGDMDLYLVNGCPTPGSPETEPSPNRLYRNDHGQFVDVTSIAGVGDTGCGMGVCSGDVDGDGWPDLFVTNFGRDVLFRNRGDGSFENITNQAGIRGEAWGTGCSFGDLDGDGDLDLYVANYVDFSYTNNPQCGSAVSQIVSYCRPTAFKGLPDQLYINQGSGRFVEEGAQRGIVSGPDEKGFGVMLSDLDNDADLDIVVANDGTMNRLYINDGEGRFEDQAMLSGLGFNHKGEAEAGMGIALGDVNNDGWMDVIMTHYAMETNTLYLNRQGYVFEDATQAYGLGDASRKPVGWGTQYFDFDRDGDLDLMVANGHVMDVIEKLDSNQTYAQANQLFECRADGTLVDLGDFTKPKVSRGLATADYNNDGRVDVLITNINDRVDLLENRSPMNHWLGIQLLGSKMNREAYGARVSFMANQKLIAMRDVTSGGSFMCHSDQRIVFGLVDPAVELEVRVRWPDGSQSHHPISERNKYVVIKKTLNPD